jgi:membrane associated rhomboid family serine protease
MIIPYKDENPVNQRPYITIILLATNLLVYLASVKYPGGLELLVQDYGFIPQRLEDHLAGQPAAILTLFSSMFIHGGLLHLAGNMLYLWIFGDNVEDRLGHARFLVFYITGGVSATLLFATTTTLKTIPIIGASGAVACVLGAYALLYPRVKVKVLLLFVVKNEVLRVSAHLVISIWALLQILSAITCQVSSCHGRVAWTAHIGGFLFGLLTVKLWAYRARVISPIKR